jgi:hypothetical protein
MKAERTTSRRGNQQRRKSVQSRQKARPVKALKVGQASPLALLQIVQPMQAFQPVQQQPESIGRLIVEEVWERVDSVSLKAFQIGEKYSKSPYPEVRAAGNILALMAMWQGVRKLDQKVGPFRL